MAAIKAFRSQMSALNIPKGATPDISIRCKNGDYVNVLAKEVHMISSLLKVGKINVIGEGDPEPEGSLKNHVSDELQTYIKVAGLIDMKLEVSE